jgi:DNA repair exonuclease SbcCD ATPase subunit
VTARADYSEDELRQQWSFLDALVERQAASLKAGVQDDEEEALVQLAVADDSLVQELESLRQRVAEIDVLRERIRELDSLRQRVSELDSLRERVRALESERQSLLQRLHAAEAAQERKLQQVPEPVAKRGSLRTWWHRVNR